MMKTMRGKHGGVKAVVGLGLALGLLAAGMARPGTAGAESVQIQPLRPGPSGGGSISSVPAQGRQWYGSVPDRRSGNRNWDHDRGGHDGWDRHDGAHWGYRP